MPTRLRSFITLALRGLLVVALLASAGCVGGAWKRAVEEDTPSKLALAGDKAHSAWEARLNPLWKEDGDFPRTTDEAA